MNSKANRTPQDKILEVKNLRISFKTNGGTVKAVRGIDFSLYRGRTLAIVGESGSGKSVTSKAILGILANNKIIEDGQIIFEGEDLLKLKEERLTKIRGVKIGMIFQDPLSSLNPIMIVGKQLTEAMVLKQKATRKEARRMLHKIEASFAKADPTETKKLTDLRRQYHEGDKIDASSFDPLFVKGVSKGVDDQIENAKEAIEEAKKIEVEFFGDPASFKMKEAYLAIRNRLYPSIKRCLLSSAITSDDTIEVFPTILKDIILSSHDAHKQTLLREKAMKKYNVSDFFSLPAKERAMMREVVKEPKEFTDSFYDAFHALLTHLGALANGLNKNNHSLAKEIENGYFDYLVDSRKTLSGKEAKEKAIKMLGEVGIDDPERRYKQYPFELSGGMRQRIVIAIALSSSPDVLICDEPTTALDVSVQSQILELINELKKEKNLSIIFITHDLGVVANMADDIAVMYAGKIVEFGTAYDIFYDPRHPYTWSLLGSMPDLKTKEKLHAIPGTPPNMLLPPKGDAFAPRNKFAIKMDYEQEPPFFEVSPSHYAATWLLHPEAPDEKVPSIVSERIRNALHDHPEYTPKPVSYKNSVLTYLEDVK